MIKRFLMLLYRVVPQPLRYRIAGSPALAPLRNALLRHNGAHKEATVHIQRSYDDVSVDFAFTASIAVAAKAHARGVENALLRLSFEALKNRLGEHWRNAVVFDVGANFGFLSLVWGASFKQNNGMVFSFEPDAALARSFGTSVRANNLSNQVKINVMGLSDAPGEIDLYTFPGGASGNPEQGFHTHVRVPCSTIDLQMKQHNLTRLDLLKIDVDSIEEQILAGGEQSILTHRPIIFTETNGNTSIPSALRKWGYSLYDVHGQPLTENSTLPHDICAVFEQNQSKPK